MSQSENNILELIAAGGIGLAIGSKINKSEQETTPDPKRYAKSDIIFATAAQSNVLGLQGNLLLKTPGIDGFTVSNSYLRLLFGVCNVISVVNSLQTNKCKPGSGLYGAISARLYGGLRIIDDNKIGEKMKQLTGIAYNVGPTIFTSNYPVTISGYDIMMINRNFTLNRRMYLTSNSDVLAKNFAYAMTFRNISPLANSLLTRDTVQYNNLESLKTATFDPSSLLVLSDTEMAIWNILRKTPLRVIVNHDTGEFLWYYTISVSDRKAIRQLIANALK